LFLYQSILFVVESCCFWNELSFPLSLCIQCLLNYWKWNKLTWWAVKWYNWKECWESVDELTSWHCQTSKYQSMLLTYFITCSKDLVKRSEYSSLKFLCYLWIFEFITWLSKFQTSAKIIRIIRNSVPT
jgi:hypothetical protein